MALLFNYNSVFLDSPEIRSTRKSMKAGRIHARKELVAATRKRAGLPFVVDKDFKSHHITTVSDANECVEAVKEADDFLHSLEHCMSTNQPLLILDWARMKRFNTEERFDGHTSFRVYDHKYNDPNDIEFACSRVREVWYSVKHAFDVTCTESVYSLQHEDGNSSSNLERLQKVVEPAQRLASSSHSCASSCICFDPWSREEWYWLDKWRFDYYEDSDKTLDFFLRVDPTLLIQNNAGLISLFRPSEIRIDTANLAVTASIPLFSITPKKKQEPDVLWHTSCPSDVRID